MHSATQLLQAHPACYKWRVVLKHICPQWFCANVWPTPKPTVLLCLVFLCFVFLNISTLDWAAVSCCVWVMGFIPTQASFGLTHQQTHTQSDAFRCHEKVAGWDISAPPPFTATTFVIIVETDKTQQHWKGQQGQSLLKSIWLQYAAELQQTIVKTQESWPQSSSFSKPTCLHVSPSGKKNACIEGK